MILRTQQLDFKPKIFLEFFQFKLKSCKIVKRNLFLVFKHNYLTNLWCLFCTWSVESRKLNVGAVTTHKKSLLRRFHRKVESASRISSVPLTGTGRSGEMQRRSLIKLHSRLCM